MVKFLSANMFISRDIICLYMSFCRALHHYATLDPTTYHMLNPHLCWGQQGVAWGSLLTITNTHFYCQHFTQKHGFDQGTRFPPPQPMGSLHPSWFDQGTRFIHGGFMGPLSYTWSSTDFLSKFHHVLSSQPPWSSNQRPRMQRRCIQGPSGAPYLV
jgi:hypothetical protein